MTLMVQVIGEIAYSQRRADQVYKTEVGNRRFRVQDDYKRDRVLVGFPLPLSTGDRVWDEAVGLL